MFKDNKFIILVKGFFKEIKQSATKLYLTTLSIFLLAFGFIFISPYIIGGSYSYENTPLDEYQILSNNISIALVNKEYNPEKGIMRMDYSLKESTTTSSLSNVQYEISSQDIKNREPHKVENIRVNDNYLVVLVEDLPKDFAVLSTTIVPSYIHPEIENSNDLESRSIKIYVNEEEKIVNNDLKKQSISQYQNEYISFQQESLKEEITLKKKELDANNIKIKELNNLISELEVETNYQTEEEKFETKKAINSHLTTITTHEKDIKEIQDEIKELKEKIELLDEKRKSINEN